MPYGGGMLQEKDIVAIALTDYVGGCKGYVGEVQAADERGVRITLVDWLIGEFVGFDLVVPWKTIQGVLVCTGDHDRDSFDKEARMFQNACHKSPPL